MTLRYCRVMQCHATSRRMALHHPASGTLLLYKQRRSSVLPLGSHSSTRVTSKHGQPTCLHRRVYGEVNDDTWRRAALVDRHGDRQHWWTSHGTGLCTVSRTGQDCGTGHCIAPYQSCRTERLHTNCTCILLTDTNCV